MALSALAKNIKRLHELRDARKAAEPEEEALKVWFKDQAGGAEPAVFEYGNREVVVSGEQRTGWDSNALTVYLKDDAENFKKTTTSVVVRCRTKKKATA